MLSESATASIHVINSGKAGVSRMWKRLTYSYLRYRESRRAPRRRWHLNWSLKPELQLASWSMHGGAPGRRHHMSKGMEVSPWWCFLVDLCLRVSGLRLDGDGGLQRHVLFILSSQNACRTAHLILNSAHSPDIAPVVGKGPLSHSPFLPTFPTFWELLLKSLEALKTSQFNGPLHCECLRDRRVEADTS